LANLGQKERLKRCRELFLEQYDKAQKKRVEEKMRTAGTVLRKKRKNPAYPKESKDADDGAAPGEARTGK
jgi:hypothetical protein